VGGFLTWQVENVPDSSDCPDASWPGQVTLDFCAKSTNVHLKVAPDVRAIRTPCVVQQLAPGDNPTGIVHQLLQDHELLVWQVNRFSPDEEPVAIKLQLYVTDSQDPQRPETLGIDRKVLAFLRYVCWPRSLH
jgi:hypothetical protein